MSNSADDNNRDHVDVVGESVMQDQECNKESSKSEDSNGSLEILEIKVDKKLPRSQRKRLLREQRRTKRKKLKHEGTAIGGDAKNIVTSEPTGNKLSNTGAYELSGNKQTDIGMKEPPLRLVEDQGYISKRLRLQQAKERCLAAMKTGQRVCIDLSLEKHMNEKEHSKLAQQLCRLYGSNRRRLNPMHVYFTGLMKDGRLYKECVRKNEGFKSYLVDMMEKTHLQLFPREDIVYLTPDSDNVLREIDAKKIYVIGGLVDESITSNITHEKAIEDGVQTARLPVDEYMHKAETGSFIKVLAVNQVFDILLEMNQSGDWIKALSIGVPKRTGYVVNE